MFWSLLLTYTVCTFYRVAEHCSHCGSFIASQARLRRELKVCMLSSGVWMLYADVSEHFLFHLHRLIQFRRRGINHKKAYNIQNTAKVWNKKLTVCFSPAVQLISFRIPASKGSKSVAGAGFLCYKAPVLTDTIKWTFCSMPTLIVL